MVTLDPINVNEPRAKRTYTYNEEDIKAIAKEGLEETLEFEAASGAKYKVFENIVDKDGHPRFIEGDVEIQEIEGFNTVYGKWSLSGSHLLIVCCGSIANGTVFSFGRLTKNIVMPKWIKDKIIPVASVYVDIRQTYAYANDLSSQSITTYLIKSGDDISITMGSITATTDKTFRIAFDLLIDND